MCCVGLPVGVGAIRNWALSDAAREASLRQADVARASNEALTTAKAAKARAAATRATAERRSQAAAEEVRVMREWDKEDRVRAAEVTAAARTSQEADAIILYSETDLAKSGNKHRRNGTTRTAAAEEAPFFRAFMPLLPWEPCVLPLGLTLPPDLCRPPPTGWGPASCSGTPSATGAHTTEAGA